MRKDAKEMSNFTANAKGGTIILTKGNDTVRLGKGTDVIRTGLNSGTNNVVYNYDSSRDILEIEKGVRIVDGVRGYSFVGNNLVMRLGNTKINLVNMVNKSVRFRVQGSSKVETANFYRELPKNTSYAKNGKVMDWTRVVANASFSASKFDMSEYNENLKTFDARNVRRYITIAGNHGNNVIYTGNYGSLIEPSRGNDTIYLGKGTDVIRVDANDGNNVVYNYDSNRDILEIDKKVNTKAKNWRGYSLVGNDLVARLGNTKLTLKNMVNKSVRFRIQGSSKVETANFYKELPKNTSYARNGKVMDWTRVVANSSFSNKFDMSEYNENLRTFDARAVRTHVYIAGNRGNNVIYAGNYGSHIKGGDGNDTIYCGNGADYIYYDNDDNNDTLVNFNAKKDVVGVGKDAGNIKSVTLDGKDVVVTIGQNKWHANHGNGSLRFKNGATMGGIRIQGERAPQKRTLAQTISYNTGNRTLTALTTNVGGNYNLASYAANAVTLNANKLRVKATLVGNAQNNTIIAGQAGSEIRAGKGNDRITCGAGADRIWFAKGDGRDTVLKSGKTDVAYLYGVRDIKQVTAKCVKGVMTLGIKGCSDTLSISGWKAGSSLSTVQLANGVKYNLAANGKLTRK